MHRLQIARPSPFARGTILLSLSSKVQELYTKYTDPFFIRVFFDLWTGSSTFTWTTEVHQIL